MKVTKVAFFLCPCRRRAFPSSSRAEYQGFTQGNHTWPGIQGQVARNPGLCGFSVMVNLILTYII